MKPKLAYTGEDKIITIELFEDDDMKKPIDLDQLTDIIMYVNFYNKRVLRIAKPQWQKSTNYVYFYIIDSSITKTFAPGDYYGEINLVFQSDKVADDKFNSIGKQYLFTIEKADVGNES